MLWKGGEGEIMATNTGWLISAFLLGVSMTWIWGFPGLLLALAFEIKFVTLWLK